MSTTNGMQTFKQLIRPSGLSFIIGMVAGMTFVAVAAYHYIYKGSQIEYYNSLLLNSQDGLTQSIAQLTLMINTSQFAGTASVFFAWVMLALVLYAVVMSINHFITGSASFVGMLQFLAPNARAGFVLEAGEHLLLRLLGALLLYATYRLSLATTPYALYTLDELHNEITAGNLMLGVLLLVGCAALLTHLLAISLRLIMVRIRVFLS